MPHAKRVQITVNTPLIIMKERKVFIAYSPAFDLASSGKTRSDAQRHFEEALDLYFEELLAHGTLEQALYELGWQKENEEWQPPMEIATVSDVSLKMPVVA